MTIFSTKLASVVSNLPMLLMKFDKKKDIKSKGSLPKKCEFYDNLSKGG